MYLIKITFLQLVVLLFINIQPLNAQPYYRMSSDFSIKIKSADGFQQLTMGTVYYDKNIEKLVHQINFPNNEIWVTLDTFMYRIVNKVQISKQKIPAIARFSVFHVALSAQLPDYGLRNSKFKADKIEYEKDMVITTWLPPDNVKDKFGKIMVSNKNKQLYGIVFFNPQGEILSKQFFEKYVNVQGFMFPTEILSITYVQNKESYELTTYKNIKVNNTNENNMYNYPVTFSK